MENPINPWMIWGEPPYFWKHPCLENPSKKTVWSVRRFYEADRYRCRNQGPNLNELEVMYMVYGNVTSHRGILWHFDKTLPWMFHDVSAIDPLQHSHATYWNIGTSCPIISMSCCKKKRNKQPKPHSRKSAKENNPTRWWQLRSFLFSPLYTYLGKWFPCWLLHIFQMGWWKTTN